MELKLLSDLKEDPKNPRTISRSASNALASSLEEFGDISGIVFNKRTDQLVTGHQRTKELKKKYGNLEIKDNTIITPTGETFKIRIVDWPIEKQHAANIAANIQTAQGMFTEDVDEILDEIVKKESKVFDDLLMEELRTKEEEIIKPKGEFDKMISAKREFPPKLGWAVIGIPYERFNEITPFLEDLSKDDTIICEIAIS